ncbi:MAG: hypothetical protein ACOCWI_00380 [Bacillota bacterium]
MKNKVLSIWNYLLSGFLGFWSLAFMSTSGLITKSSTWGGTFTAKMEMYELIVFDSNSAISAAAVFQIFMIIISVVLLLLALVQVLKLHGVKISFLDKVFEIKINIKKEFDLVTLLVFAYILFSLLTIICLAVGGRQNSFEVDATNYSKTSIGFGPIWLFISSIIIALKIIFKDKVLLIGKKALSMVPSSGKNEEQKKEPLKKEKDQPAEKIEQTHENKEVDSSEIKEQPIEKKVVEAVSKQQKPVKKEEVSASKEEKKPESVNKASKPAGAKKPASVNKSSKPAGAKKSASVNKSSKPARTNKPASPKEVKPVSKKNADS